MTLNDAIHTVIQAYQASVNKQTFRRKHTALIHQKWLGNRADPCWDFFGSITVKSNDEKYHEAMKKIMHDLWTSAENVPIRDFKTYILASFAELTLERSTNEKTDHHH